MYYAVVIVDILLLIAASWFAHHGVYGYAVLNFGLFLMNLALAAILLLADKL